MNSDVPELDGAVVPFLDGALAGSESEATLDVINPSNGRRILSIPAGCEGDVDRAVASSRRAFDGGHWSVTPPSFRQRILYHFAELIENDARELDVLDAGEMGKPVGESASNAAAASNLLRFCAGGIDKVLGEVYSSDKGSFVAQRRVPRGVVAAVLPWNFPTYNAVLKLAPALAAGNCVILKPSELSSRSAIRLARLAAEAGLPPGVFNVVLGLGEPVGRALGLHMDVDMLTFTGSTVVGKQMLQHAGRSNMKVVMAECGGKSPHIVFDDGVDLDVASESIARMLLINQGQLCSLGSRVLVQRSIETAMLEKITRHLSGVVLGDALDPETTFGPLASSQQCDRVMHYIDTARAEGAQLVVGGRRVLRDSGGFFVEPTVFRNVSHTARIAQEEIFGPVLSVITFENEAEAIHIANDTIYGLVAYVWTASLSRGMRMAKQIRSSVLVNEGVPVGEGAGHASPFEPLGQSGIGTEGGIAGIESYLRRQLVWISHK
jgi:acyl-CoA reductase-like NAD-dependent aldehyde dehydrogenase